MSISCLIVVTFHDETVEFYLLTAQVGLICRIFLSVDYPDYFYLWVALLTYRLFISFDFTLLSLQIVTPAQRCIYLGFTVYKDLLGFTHQFNSWRLCFHMLAWGALAQLLYLLKLKQWNGSWLMMARRLQIGRIPSNRNRWFIHSYQLMITDYLFASADLQFSKQQQLNFPSFSEWY